MANYPFTAADLAVLKRWDTPTICNGLELLSFESRSYGFTVEQMVAVDRKLPPIIGLARTGFVRAKEPPRGPIPSREDWYDYVAPVDIPTIAVIQDLDHVPGFGAFWGEVQTTIHAALGVEGSVTNGSFRDCDMLAPGFQIIGGRVTPSHGHIRMTHMDCEVNIFGMCAGHDDVIHADFHGAVVIPHKAVTRLPEMIERVTSNEALVLGPARTPGFTTATMRQILGKRREEEIH